jgi:hypothetical protein
MENFNVFFIIDNSRFTVKFLDVKAPLPGKKLIASMF